MHDINQLDIETMCSLIYEKRIRCQSKSKLRETARQTSLHRLFMKSLVLDYQG